ncbi:MAG TPA: hypothetical protein VKK79_08415 [Candidatus Lokiarchaeia archaeon]|nr:hypothetical protein [Candidatus Lokiarchaeia archaeon]
MTKTKKDPPVRCRYQKGKEIRVKDPNGYEITLSLKNAGSNPIIGMTITDTVPAHFQFVARAPDPNITEVDGESVLEWHVDTLAPGELWETRYIITGTGEFKPKEAKFRLPSHF